MLDPVLLIPLDERPCCWQFVERLADIAAIQVMSPPRSLLGCFLQPGQPAALIDWYEENRGDAQGAIVSLDMLAFGGLVASRKSEPPLHSARELLGRWLQVCGPNVWAFQSVLRTAPTQTNLEEMRQAQILLQLSTFPDDRDLQESLPVGVLERYHATRRRNHQLNLDALEWSRQELLTYLLMGIDDSKTAGWNVQEVRELERWRPQRAGIAPGTDESAQLLLARLLRGELGRKIQVRWSHPELPQEVTRYEDRCLGDLLQAQLAASAMTLSEESRWQLWIYGRPGKQGEAEDQEVLAVPPAFLVELGAALRQGKRIVIADVAHANGGDIGLGKALAPLFGQLLGYSAWNTAGNTMGTALAWLGCAAESPGSQQRRAEQRFAQERWLDDLIYQSLVRPQLKKEFATLGLNLQGETLMRCQEQLARRLQEASAGLGLEVGSITASLPWSRLFEIAVEVNA